LARGRRPLADERLAALAALVGAAVWEAAIFVAGDFRRWRPGCPV
jgi:hypothetical protein